MNKIKSVSFLLFFFCLLNVSAIEVCDSLRANETASVKTITRDELKQFGAASVFKILSILDPSIVIQDDLYYGSDPNNIANITIRDKDILTGVASLPVFMIDGYEVNPQYVYDMDIERIEKIHILKDAAASVIYGSRSANGVIAIETRSPETGAFRISYANRISLSKADLSSFDFMNAAERLEAERQSGLWSSSDPLIQHQMDSICNVYGNYINNGVNTAWHKEPLRNAFSHQHALYVSGRPGKWAYGASGNYNKNNGVMKSSQRENYGFSAQLGYLNKKRITVRNDFSWNKTLQKIPLSSYSDYVSNSSYLPLYDNVGDLIPTYPHAGGYNSTQYNWVYHAKTFYKNESSGRSLNNNLSVELKILSGLSLKTEATYSKEKWKAELYIPTTHPSFSNIDFYNRGLYRYAKYTETNWNIRAALNYAVNIRRHCIAAGVGYNFIQTEADINQITSQGYPSDRPDNLSNAGSSTMRGGEYKVKLSSVFGTLNYTYDKRYQLDISFKNDHISAMEDGEKNQNSWSAGAGWNIHNEAFLAGTDWLTTLRIRGSIGEMNGPEQFLFALATSNLYQDMNTTLGRRVKQNIGLDFGMAEDRLSLVLNYYSYRSKGIGLELVPAPGDLSFYSPLHIRTKKHGMEAYLQGSILRQKDYEWKLSLSTLYNKNKTRDIIRDGVPGYIPGDDNTLSLDPGFDTGWRGTIGTCFNWRQFSLDIAMQYGLGGKQYSSSLYEKLTPGGRDPNSNTTRWLEDNDYLRMSNIALFYTLNKDIVKRLYLNNLEVGINISDLFYTTKADSPRGREYPFAKQYTFNLRFNL